MIVEPADPDGEFSVMRSCLVDGFCFLAGVFLLAPVCTAAAARADLSKQSENSFHKPVDQRACDSLRERKVTREPGSMAPGYGIARGGRAGKSRGAAESASNGDVGSWPIPAGFSGRRGMIASHMLGQADDFSDAGADFSEAGDGFSEAGDGFSEAGDDFSEAGDGFSEAGDDFSEPGDGFSEAGDDFSGDSGSRAFDGSAGEARAGWFGQRGLARFVSGTALTGKSKGSIRERLWWGADYSLPVYESERHTFLCELGARAVDKRNLVDTGLVYRYTLPIDTVAGLNFFVSHDPERGHTRASAGMEMMGSWWQTSANYYWPVSGWKTRDPSAFAFGLTVDAGLSLQERLVRQSMDARLELFLPGYRALSAGATYKRRLGESANTADKLVTFLPSPVDVEGRLSWRLMKLMKLSVSHTLPGKTSKNSRFLSRDTRFLLEFGLNMAQPLVDQQFSRSAEGEPGIFPMQGVRHQFVRRNTAMERTYRLYAREGDGGGGYGGGTLGSGGLGGLSVTVGTGDLLPKVIAGNSMTVVAQARHVNGLPAPGEPLEWTVLPARSKVTIVQKDTETDSQGCARMVLTSAVSQQIGVTASVVKGGKP